MRESGYGSPAFLRACRVAAEWRQIEGRKPRAVWRRLLAGSPVLWTYRLRLPSTTIRLTESAAGHTIGEHFAIRDGNRWRYRGAQGVLPLPAEYSQYLRGRHRQAVRTNLRHARRAGLSVKFRTEDGWEPGSDDSRAVHLTPAPIERWSVFNADGALIAHAILSVDEDVALLHGLVSYSAHDFTHPRWLLHAAIVERLCGNCTVLVTNSDDAYLIDAGNQHFQRLLGYEIMRLKLSRSRPAKQLPSLATPPLTEVELQGGRVASG